MKKNSSLKLVLAIIGALAVIGSIVVTVIHFWDDIKKLLPCGKCEEAEDLEDLEDIGDVGDIEE